MDRIMKPVMFSPHVFVSELLKYQFLTGASDADIRRVAGWSESTMRRRLNNPKTITLGEANELAHYFNMEGV